MNTRMAAESGPVHTTDSVREMDEDDIPVGRYLTRREAMRHLAGLGIGLAGVSMMISGCGGGVDGSALTGTGTATSTGTGRAVMTIEWPEAGSSTRLIPTASSSITVAFSQSGTVVATQTVARPTTGTTSTVTFASLPPGTLTVTATAYPNSDGSGTAQAAATASATITASQTTTVSITMSSAIDHLTITGSTSVTAGSTTALSAAAYNSSGRVVLISSSNLSWTSANTAVATVESSTGVVTGIKAGTATITATESESGKSITFAITVTAQTVSCVAFPSETEGPYWVDEGLNRSDVRGSNSSDNGAILDTPSGSYVQGGIPLNLEFYLVNVNGSCAAVSGAKIDIWQCNANGIYSNESVESTKGQTFLRGYQTTDSSGKVNFTTIYPGWYSGRTTHIHFRVRFTSGSKTYNLTGQLFFNETITSQVYQTTYYKSHGQKDTSNASDMVYNSPTTGTGASMVLSLSGSTTAGYSASFVVGVAV